MKTEKFKDMSEAKLLRQGKTIKVVTGVLAGMLLTQFVCGVYLYTQKGFNVFLVLPLSLFPILIINLNAAKEIKKELERRGTVG